MSQASRDYEDWREKDEQQQEQEEQQRRIAMARDYLIANGWCAVPSNINA